MEEKKLNSVENVNVVVENSTKEKVNKVSAKKAKAQSKANNILYKDILANLNKSTEGLLKTSFGVKKSDIYKEEIFSELSDKEKKVARKKFRNTILSLSESLTQEKTGQSQSVGNHAVARKNLGGTCRYFVVVIGKCSVKACSVTYFCNHFRSYSWVSTMTFLHTSISSMLSFSNL